MLTQEVKIDIEPIESVRSVFIIHSHRKLKSPVKPSSWTHVMEPKNQEASETHFVPEQEVTYCKQSNNASWKTACLWGDYGRMLRLTPRRKAQCEERKENIGGPTCIMLCFSSKNIKNHGFPFEFINLSTHTLKSEVCSEQLILQVCNMRHYSLLLLVLLLLLLLLHNFDPGYRYKIML